MTIFPIFQVQQQQQNMQQLTEHLQIIKKPAQFKLTPLSPIARKNIHSNTAPSPDYHALPSILKKFKLKTEPSTRTENTADHTKHSVCSEEKQQASPSDRLLSRFIFNHLQKKINFQQQLYTQINKTPIIHQPTDYAQGKTRQIDLSLYQKSQKYRKHIYGYEKDVGNPSQSNLTEHIRNKNHIHLKNKYLNKHKNVKNLMVDNHSQIKKRNRYTNIDAYFDLSCLKSDHRRQKINSDDNL